jgi:Family of unknown function (DUF5681)
MPEKTVARSQNLRPWRKGQSGNPKGRPRGKSLKRIARESGVDPKQFLLRVVGNGKVSIRHRIEAARAIMPFLHPRLSSTEVRVPTPIQHVTKIVTRDELKAELEERGLPTSIFGIDVPTLEEPELEKDHEKTRRPHLL